MSIRDFVVGGGGGDGGGGGAGGCGGSGRCCSAEYNLM